MSGKKRKPTHREILLYWEEHILNRNLGISEHGNAAFYFVDSVLRAYATSEQVNADRKKNSHASVSTQEPRRATEQGAKVSNVIEGGSDE